MSGGSALNEIGAPETSSGAPITPIAAQFTLIGAAITVIGGAIWIFGATEMPGGGWLVVCLQQLSLLFGLHLCPGFTLSNNINA